MLYEGYIFPFYHFGIIFTKDKCQSAIQQQSYGAFSFTVKTRLPAKALAVYHAATVDLSFWWDHTFSAKPYKLFIDVQAGTRFGAILFRSACVLILSAALICRRSNQGNEAREKQR